MKSAPWDEYKEQPPERIVVQQIKQPPPPFIARILKAFILIAVGFIAYYVPAQRKIWLAQQEGYQRGWQDCLNKFSKP